MKYIVLKAELVGLEVPVIFPNVLVHAHMATVVSVLLSKTMGGEVSVVSAGEYNPLTGECYGKSTSLGVKSRGPKDDALLSLNDYGAGH